MTIGSTICVLGMHRSGTSLVAGILNILGMNLGRELHLMKPRGDNPKGFWEHQLLTDLNDEILSRFGGTWDRPPTFPQGWEIYSTLDDLRQKALAIIDDDFRDAKLWGWKDPRTCLTLPFWQQLIPDMRYVLCLRNPIDVAHSLKHRDGFTLNQGIGLWLQYTASSLRSTSAKPRLIISYDDILDKRDDLIDLLCKLTGNHSLSQDTFNTINGLIDHDLRHHHTASADEVDNSPLSFPAQALFSGLHLYTRVSGISTLPTTTVDQEVQAAFDNLAVGATQAHYNRIIELNDAIAEKDQYARVLENLTAQQEQALARIYQSHGWKALLAYYKMRNLIFPPGSQRKLFAQKIFHVLLRTKKTLTIEDNHRNPTRLQAKLDGCPAPQEQRNIAACTIISKNYIAFARTLAESFHRFHPDAPFFVLLVDRVDGHFDAGAEQFILVTVEELDIPDIDTFQFKYTILELNTAVKPYFLSYLFEKYQVTKVLYLDPDILVTEKLDNLYGLLNDHSIALAPHLTAALDDDYRPTELDILQAGTFNLGFIGLAKNPEVRSFLRWWGKRVYDGCFMAPEKGMHVDQKWIDLVPGLFDKVLILRDPGYDVAYWNLHNRSIRVLDGRVLVNGGPCYFFHFSGFDPCNPSLISKHQNRFSLKDIGDGARLFEQYGELVNANGYQNSHSWPYAFGYFDNGVKIPDTARRMYHQLGKERKKFGNPFATESTNSFLNWLNSPAEGTQKSDVTISQLWAEIYSTRPDVQNAFPDLFGKDNLAFARWIVNIGMHEYQIDERLIPQGTHANTHVPLKRSAVRLLPQLYVNHIRSWEAAVRTPLKRTIGRHHQVWTALKKARNRLIFGKQTFTSTLNRNWDIVGPRAFGVNLTGHLRSEKGVGEAARAAARALEAASIPFALNDVADAGSVNEDSAFTKFTDDNPYIVNLLHINADQVPIVAMQKGDNYFKGRYNIGCWFWELSQFPEEWHSSFGYFNELWAPTSFIHAALSRVSPIPVIKMPLALAPEVEVIPNLARQNFGLPIDGFMILSILDFASVLERKNPLGLIQAFKRAFNAGDNAVLVLKVAHSEQYPRESAALRRACTASNVRIVDRILSRQEMNTLLSLCDCYASLHRSEGYGLPIAEAMSLGKPVVVTAYSGNMDFTTPANSLLVKYRLTEIDRDYGFYRKGWVWADPDLEHAAESLRYLYENRNEAQQIGSRAKQDILEQFHPKDVGKQTLERLQRIASYGAFLGIGHKKPVSEITSQ